MKFNDFFYDFCRLTVSLFLKTGWRLDVQNSENVPSTGGAIIAANHRSYSDPPVLGAALHRRVHFLAKKELFSFRPFGWLITHCNAHPIDRGGDVAALRTARRILSEGHLMIMFPEGRRVKKEEFDRPKSGVGLLAAKTKCLVIPAYIHNSSNFKKMAKIQVIFGKPLKIGAGQSYHGFAEKVIGEIRAIKDKVVKNL